MEKLGELVKDLETLVEFCKANADLPATAYGSTIYIHLPHENSREILAKYCRAMGKVQKNPIGETFWVDGHFGSLQLSVCADRKEVCTKRVVKKIVPATVKPAQPEQVIPEHEEEVVEWDCGSILAPETEAATV